MWYRQCHYRGISFTRPPFLLTARYLSTPAPLTTKMYATAVVSISSAINFPEYLLHSFLATILATDSDISYGTQSSDDEEHSLPIESHRAATIKPIAIACNNKSTDFIFPPNAICASHIHKKDISRSIIQYSPFHPLHDKRK